MNPSIGKYFSSIYRAQSIYINQLCQGLGFGSSQYIYLLRIYDFPGITQKELSELVLINKANTNRALKKLIDLGYIISENDKSDLRVKRNYLTDLGQEVVKELLKRLQSVSSTLSEGISKDDMDMFYKVIQQMESNIVTAVKENHG